ncbi:MAG: Glycosyl transferase group 1 [Microgenomates bacterium OLB23]|nr:MAG: Glycosyl transferase group 1 [Microgenomates bacterium OLB23]
MPLLEAMRYRCPVVASKAASLPEVGGDAALYFNPNDPRDIERKIIEVTTKPHIRQSLVKKGLKKSTIF